MLTPHSHNATGPKLYRVHPWYAWPFTATGLGGPVRAR
jgi:hypothetical protein